MTAGLVVLAVVGSLVFFLAASRNEVAQRTAESINNDLGFEPGTALTDRQRNALWKLALAEEAVKSDFVSILARSPEETIRVSPGLFLISRALGLQRRARRSTSCSIRSGTNPDALRALAEALQALPVKLTEPQASQALDPVLKQIGHTTNPDALRTLAQVLQALAPKLSKVQAEQASEDAAASLAWAANDEEAAEWARALVTLAHPAKRDGMVVNIIAYPASAGSATEILLGPIRAACPDSPAKEAGIEPALAWLAKTFPDVLHPPLCPEPLQTGPNLKCPSARQQD